MVVSFHVLIWPVLPSYDLVPCHLLFHSVPGCSIWQVNHSSQGGAAWSRVQAASSYLGTGTFPISLPLQNSCTAICL